MNTLKEKWDHGDPYEYFMGRWSRLMAPEFLSRLNIPPALTWLYIGCGTGALSEAILKNYKPSFLTSIDSSKSFIAKVKEKFNNRGEFLTGIVNNLPLEADSVDIIVSGLALNFFPDLEGALEEMKRVSKPGGSIAAYVWDYSDRIDLLRYFWDSAFLIDPKSRELDLIQILKNIS